MAGVTGVTATRPDLSLPAATGVNAPAGQAAPSLPSGLRLRIFQPTGRVYAEVLDPDSHEVVKTIPPMELLKVMARVQQQIGLLLDREG
jgi:hypothetical protein